MNLTFQNRCTKPAGKVFGPCEPRDKYENIQYFSMFFILIFYLDVVLILLEFIANRKKKSSFILISTQIIISFHIDALI